MSDSRTTETVVYGSVCSGIEAATVAWHPLGWRAAFFAEIDAFPSALLAHHYPDVPNLGDMTRFQEWPDAALDVLVGGTPCQSFSIAGLRKGLADPRGGLALTFLEIAQRYRPRWVLWENVPGVLSQDGGRAFGSFLGGLEELGYGWAYRVLDAQYFELAQRRARVFVVGSARGWASAAAVLFEPASLSGHPAPSRAARKDIARPIGAGSARGSGYRNDADTADNLVTAPLTSNPYGDHESRESLLIARHVSTRGGQRYDCNWGSRRRAGIVSTAVRRLTPRECERLQGFHDDYTLILYKGAPAKDAPRYKALGNSMAVPVIRWLGERMAMVDSLAQEIAA